MSKLHKSLATTAVLISLITAAATWADDRFPGIGRPATMAEIAAWDIDVRPDFRGLPKGSGSVAQGQEIWETKCASCHGIFGESNQVFTPLIGGTEKTDEASGRVAKLRRPDFPQRTTFMKAPTISTVYDYIRRAMPWTDPKSLSNDEVYAVLAYMLNLAEIVPDDYVLDDKTIRDVQAKLPNRNGMTTKHAMWFGSGFGTHQPGPDTHNTACLRNCVAEVEIVSSLPDYAQSSHGNLAAQQRRIGPVRGKITGDSDPDAVDDPSPAGYKLAQASGCMACHGLNTKIVGPSLTDVAAKYRGQDVSSALLRKIKQGGDGVWGQVPMPPQGDIGEADASSIVAWILTGAPAR